MKAAIQDLIVTPLKIIEDKRGSVMHMLRSDAPHFDQFGEVYFSLVKPNNVKAWKRHKRMTLNISVPVGKVRFVIFDDRSNSSSFKEINELVLGPDDQYALITIPPMVWLGFQNIGISDALLANCATIPYDPEEADQLSIKNEFIEFDWSIN